MPSQLRDQRLLSRESAPPQPRDHSLSASLTESVIRLISTCQQVEECLLSRAKCISQPVDVHVLSPAISAYSAARSMPVSRLRRTCQPLDQHLSASLSEPISCLISTCQQVEECLLSRANSISQPVDLHLLRPAITAYSAARLVPVSCLRSNCQPVDQHLSAS